MKTIRTVFAVILAAGAIASSAGAAELITNGDFEVGSLAGWTVIDQPGSSGSWFLGANGGGSPLNGFPTPTLMGGGSFNAQTDQGGPGSHQLTQSFVLTAGNSYILNFDAYGSDASGSGPVGTGLDYTTGPNQHAEVNLFGPGGVLAYSGIFTTDWAHYTFDLSGAVTSSGAYTLSFGEVDNLLFFNVGVDNVSLFESGGAVPEPATWAMMLLGFFGLGSMVRRRKAVFA